MFASKVLIPLGLALCSGLVLAKLPAPSDEAKAKAAEAAAKTAWSNKVADFQLCKSQDKVAGAYIAQQKKAAAPAAKPASGVPVCADPGPFAYIPPAPASAPAAAAAPAAAPPPAKKT